MTYHLPPPDIDRRSPPPLPIELAGGDDLLARLPWPLLVQGWLIIQSLFLVHMIMRHLMGPSKWAALTARRPEIAMFEALRLEHGSAQAIFRASLELAVYGHDRIVSQEPKRELLGFDAALKRHISLTERQPWRHVAPMIRRINAQPVQPARMRAGTGSYVRVLKPP